MKTTLPKITTIVAVYNNADTLSRFFESFVGQSYPHKELIVIDGGSTDASVSLIKKYEGYIAYWESQPDRGIFHAWNKALKHANGEWIHFLGADDYFWNKEVLQDVVKSLSIAYPSYRIVYGRVALIDDQRKIQAIIGESWNKAQKNMSLKMPIPHTATFHHKSLFKVHGNFTEKYRIAGDYDMVLRELRDHDALFLDDRIVAGMQVGGLSSSYRNAFVALKENYHIQGLLLGKKLKLASMWMLLKAVLKMILVIFLGEKRVRRWITKS